MQFLDFYFLIRSNIDLLGFFVFQEVCQNADQESPYEESFGKRTGKGARTARLEVTTNSGESSHLRKRRKRRSPLGADPQQPAAQERFAQPSPEDGWYRGE
jgi:hypothetical protein